MGIRKFPIVLVTILIGFLFFPATPLQPSTKSLNPTSRQNIAFQDDISRISDYLPYILHHTSGEKVSLPLIMAVMKAESNFDPQAVSRKGALGLMQLMPVTALEEYNRYGHKVPIPTLKKNLISQPELNLLLGIRYIKTLDRQLAGVNDQRYQRALVIAAYNAGLKRVKRAFGCNGTQCLIWRANNSGSRFFRRSLRRLPLETRRYLHTVDRAFRYFDQVFYAGEVDRTNINQIKGRI